MYMRSIFVKQLLIGLVAGVITSLLIWRFVAPAILHSDEPTIIIDENVTIVESNTLDNN